MVVSDVVICDVCCADLSSLLSVTWNVFSTPGQATKMLAHKLLVFTHFVLYLESVQLSLTPIAFGTMNLPLHGLKTQI